MFVILFVHSSEKTNANCYKGPKLGDANLEKILRNIQTT